MVYAMMCRKCLYMRWFMDGCDMMRWSWYDAIEMVLMNIEMLRITNVIILNDDVCDAMIC